MQEPKKQICKNFLENRCGRGSECLYRHPTKPNLKQSEVCTYFQKGNCKRGDECPFLHRGSPIANRNVCTFFLQNKCKRGYECPYLHEKPHAGNQQRMDWISFCPYFSNGYCRDDRDCRFLHVLEKEKEAFRLNGRINHKLLEQAKCKALLQQVTLDGFTQTCQGYLKGSCEWRSCPMLHLTKEEFSQEILSLLTEKFNVVLGPKGTFTEYKESDYSESSGFQNHYAYDDYIPYDAEPYGVNLGRNPSRVYRPDPSGLSYERNYTKPNESVTYGVRLGLNQAPPREAEAYRVGFGRNQVPPQEAKPYRMNDDPDRPSTMYKGRPEQGFNQKDFIQSETDKIIKGIYHLMKEDSSLLRDPVKEEISDLRYKLNRLAEENARYRSEFSRMPPRERDGFEHYRLPYSHRENYNYNDAVQRLERENMEMRRQLSYYSGNYSIQQGGSSLGIDTRRYGLPIRPRPPSYPAKPKTHSQMNPNSLQQKKSEIRPKKSEVQKKKSPPKPQTKFHKYVIRAEEPVSKENQSNTKAEKTSSELNDEEVDVNGIVSSEEEGINEEGAVGNTEMFGSKGRENEFQESRRNESEDRTEMVPGADNGQGDNSKDTFEDANERHEGESTATGTHSKESMSVGRKSHIEENFTDEKSETWSDMMDAKEDNTEGTEVCQRDQ